MDGILLLANGQAGQGNKETLLQLAEESKRNLGTDRIGIAYLHDQMPDVPTAVLACVKRGITRLQIIPWLIPKELLQEAEHTVRIEVEEFRGLHMLLAEPAYEDFQVFETIRVFLTEEKVIEEEETL